MKLFSINSLPPGNRVRQVFDIIVHTGTLIQRTAHAVLWMSALNPSGNNSPLSHPTRPTPLSAWA